MKRLSLFGSWKRLGVQVGLLAGVGLAFIGGTEPTPARAEPVCVEEGECTFVKPLFMIIADYSTSMNTAFGMQGTRWDAAVAAIEQMIDADNGYLQGNVLLGLMRFGHDPNANQMGTLIPNDTSGITDGQKIDVGFYNEQDPNNAYYHCNGEAIKMAINTVAAPMNGNLVGIGTWTKGALDKAQAYIQQTWADHPADPQQRRAAIVLLTDGEWTDPSGTMKLMPATQNPSLTSANLYNNLQVPTYVVAIGEAMGKMFADEIAAMGGTGQAYDAVNPQALVDALKAVVQDLIDDVIQPTCAPGLPRIMVLLDASSSMLNIGGGMMYGGMGATGWDQARDALAGPNSLFDVEVFGDQQVENLVHLGLAVFGHNQPAEEKILVDYGPCMKDNFAWALDPNTSCAMPGCDDPWGGPPITWTFQTSPPAVPMGKMDPFDATTRSHMPQCGPLANAYCSGSGTYTHLGLNLVQQNIAAYKAACVDPMYPYPCDANTKFINILVTDGNYNSMAAQVQAPLQQMFTDGVTTYVIGFGDAPSLVLLNQMAGWGSGGANMAYDANNQGELEAALQAIIEGITFDPCCGFNDCAVNPEPDTNEPDPLPGMTTTTGDTTDTGTGSSTTDMTTSGSTTDMTTTMGVTDTAGMTTTTTDGTTTAPTTSATGTTTDTGGSDSNSGTGVPTTGGGTSVTAGSATTADTGTDTETGTGATDSATGGTGTEDGCGCKVDDAGQTRGLLASLFTLGLAGFIRRRRRAA